MKFLTHLLLVFTSFSTFAQADKVAAILAQIDSSEHLSGVVLVAKEGELIFEKPYGMADYALNEANQLDTKFLVGSLTKQFTAVLVTQMVEATKLKLDEPISTYLPDFRKDLGDKITIRHLLTHTHGIPNAELTNRLEPMAQEDFIKKYAETDLEFEPGSQFKYSDIIGYYLLGVILEKITNRKYADLLDEKILQPLHMENSGYYSQEADLQNFANGYLHEGESFHKAPVWDISQSFSAAGLYTTAGDLFKWSQALRGSKLLSASSLETIFTPYSQDIRYGFGWFINDPEINGKKRIFAGHNGGANGYKAQMMRGVKEEYLVIYLSNTDKYTEIRYPIIEALLNTVK